MSVTTVPWVVIPAFNEASVIREVVAGLRGRGYPVVLVDDCSSDTTGSAACAAGAIVLRHAVNLGQGAALQTGITFALRQGAEQIVTFDADGQHRAEDIDTLLDAWRQTLADAVFGSRFLGATVNMPAMRRLALRVAVTVSRLIGRSELTDAHNGLRLLTRRAASGLALSQNRMAHATELVAQVRRLGCRIAEAPVTVVYTDYSLRKGQKLGNAFNILAELLVGKMSK